MITGNTYQRTLINSMKKLCDIIRRNQTESNSHETNWQMMSHTLTLTGHLCRFSLSLSRVIFSCPRFPINNFKALIHQCGILNY